MSSLRDNLLDWSATAAAVGGVFTALGVYDVLMRVAMSTGGIHAQQRASQGMARAINRAAGLAGTRFRVAGLENAPFGRPYIIVSNHQSLLDISLITEYLGALEPRYVSKRELSRGIPGVSFNLRAAGSACIDRKDPEQAHAAIEQLARRITVEGFSVVIFPEGTRSATGAMRPFREAGLRTLVRNARGVPVLPVTTAGGSVLFRDQLKPIARGVTLSLTIHPPVSPPDPDDAEAFSAFVRSCAATIERALPEADREGRALVGAKSFKGSRSGPSRSSETHARSTHP